MIRTIPRKTNTQRIDAVTVAAPVGGWNARDALGAMAKLDAVTLTNWWPGTNSVLLRKGWTIHVDGFAGDVETLMTYNSGTASKMFAAVGANIYNVTASGTPGAPVVSTATSARYQHVNFTTTANSYLLCVNGADKQRIYDGTNWHQDGDGAPYDVTVFNTQTASNITVFKSRIWYVQENTLKAWYLPINSIGGAATVFDLSGVFMKGGRLIAAMTWTLDAGYGADDYLAFITSEGEVAAYRLTDPTAPSGIALVGIYTVGAPVGDRCYIKYGGDLLILTQDGVSSMNQTITSDRTSQPVSIITDKIRLAVSEAITEHGTNFGWQLFFFPKQNQLYLNVPIEEGDSQQQYVQNNITKAWCNFTNQYAGCWELLDDEPYFGSSGYVGHAWHGTVDNESDIRALALQSFQAYGGARQKQCKMIRYHFLTDAQPTIYGNVNVDYDLSDNAAQLSALSINYGLWDVGLWDAALWGGALVPSANWEGATGIGFTFAPFLKTATQDTQLEWVATDMVFERGGIL